MVIDEFVAAFLNQSLLQVLDPGIDELDHFAGIHINHMIVMGFTGQFVDSPAVVEVVTVNDPGCFKLGQYPVHGSQCDGFPSVRELLVHVLGTQMMRLRTMEQLQYFNSRQRDFESSAFEVGILHAASINPVGEN